jgi:hypothetical protein
VIVVDGEECVVFVTDEEHQRLVRVIDEGGKWK